MSERAVLRRRGLARAPESRSDTGWPSWRLEPMATVVRMSEMVGPTDVTVLLLGETGVGKEMLARCLHRCSPRVGGPFVKINCAAMPLTLLESELFGYEQGAFTGAERRKPGKFEQAHQGTIFLDEIGEMPLPLQAKLLHVLQDGSFSRLGGVEEVQVDVRVVAATNRDLMALVARGAFREDLFYRLSVVNIKVPALRERRAEIPILVRYFLAQWAERDGRPRPVLSAATMRRLAAAPWPGNVRELENAVRRIVLLGEEAGLEALASAPGAGTVTPGGRVRGEDAASPPRPSAGDHSTASEEPSLAEVADRARRAAERQAIEATLQKVRWRRREAARVLKVSYRTLIRKMQDYELG